jgi:hypothetical protein
MTLLSRITALAFVILLPGVTHAEDFGPRFSWIDTGARPANESPTTVLFPNTQTLKSAVPPALVGWTFDNRSFVGFSTALEAASYSNFGCGEVCKPEAADRLRALLGFGDRTTLFYVAAGLALHNRSDDYGFTGLNTGLFPEKSTLSFGVTYNLTSQVKVWGQIDRVAYGYDGLPPNTFAGMSALGAAFAFKGGLIMPFSPFTGGLGTLVAADETAKQSAREKLWRILFPPFMPK